MKHANVRFAALALCAAAAAFARPAAAQIRPPNIQGPINAAKKAAGSTSAGIVGAQKAAADAEKTQLPAAAAQAGAKGAPSTAGEAKSMKAAADRKAAGEKIAQAAAAADSSSRRGSASQSASKAAATVYREEFMYDDEGRRDPFVSLMASGDIRPLFNDLTLIGVMYDIAQPARSIAIVLDVTSGETYRVKSGSTLGRMKVTKVRQNEMALSIDEFGFSRQETLPLDMTSRRTGAAPGRRP